MVMGSRTYEKIPSFGDWPHKDRPVHVLTSRLLHPPPGASVKFWNLFVSDLVEYLDNTGIQHAWLVGGSATNGAFLAADLIDTIVLSIIPTILGDGIPLFPAKTSARPLAWVSTESFPGGVVQTTYDVQHG